MGITLVMHHLISPAAEGVMLHFFYLPIIIAAHYVGRNLACTLALFTFLEVSIFAIIAPERYMQTITSPVIMALTLVVWGGFLGFNALLFGTLCDQRAAHIKELREAHMGIIEILSKYLQAADHYTKSHSMRVADLAEAISDQMGLKQAEIENIRVGALLHDIGKVEISTRLITKAAGLTDTEREEMANHIVHGAELVRSLGTVLEGAVPIILHHHDHYGATSSPTGDHGEDIPIGARVVAVADAYDAIVTDRPYRRGRTPDEAIAIIREASGAQFDPNVVRAFERVMRNRLNEPEADLTSAGQVVASSGNLPGGPVEMVCTEELVDTSEDQY
jgi:putative nucleotidyltransferase with HDIG domain